MTAAHLHLCLTLHVEEQPVAAAHEYKYVGPAARGVDIYSRAD